MSDRYPNEFIAAQMAKIEQAGKLKSDMEEFIGGLMEETGYGEPGTADARNLGKQVGESLRLAAGREETETGRPNGTTAGERP